MIEEMKKEDLPNLVDERRFRRREPENFERDEYGRVRLSLHLGHHVANYSNSASGPKRRSP